MIKKITSSVVALTMMISVLAGCGGAKVTPSAETTTTTTTQAATTEPAKKVSIRIVAREAGPDWNGTLDNFRKANPNITVVDESIMGDNDSAFNDKIKTAIAAGDLFEVTMNYGGQGQKEYAKNGLFVDLQPYLDADPQWKDNMVPLFDLWQFEGIKGTFGVPRRYFAVGIFYNKDFFAKNNLQPAKTIDEFTALCDKINSLGVVPIAMSGKDNWRHAHLLTNLSMGKFGFQKSLDLGARRAKYTDPEMVDLFKTVKDWQNKGYFGKNIMSMDYTREQAMFRNGETAMHMDGSWFIGSSKEGDAVTNDKIGFTLFPNYADKPELRGSNMGGADGGLVVANSKDKDKVEAAVKLVKHLTSVETYKYVQRETKAGVFAAKFDPEPGVLDALTTDYIKILNQEGKDFKTELDMYDPLTNMMDVFRNSIQGMLAGNTPEKAAAQIQSEIDKQK